MKIIGIPECSIQYRFITKQSIINGAQLLGLGIHERIMKEFSIEKFDRPKDLDKTSIKLENGHVEVDGTKYSVSQIIIANAGLQAIVWGPSSVAERVIERVQSIIEANLPGVSLKSLKKHVKFESTFKVNLDVNPEFFISKELLPVFKEFGNQMPRSECSRVEIHFPVLGAAIVTKPNLETMLTKVAADKLETEIEAATTTRTFQLSVSDVENYATRVFDADIEADFDSATSLLEKIEKILKAS